MNGKLFVGNRVSSFEKYDELGPISGVSLYVDDENQYFSGNESGYILEAECPYGSQEMADFVLSQAQGSVYKGYRGTDAVIDPSCELGDGITVCNEYSMLAYRLLEFGPGHMSEVAAPGECTLDHEYPYISTTQRNIKRKFSETKSLITKTAEQIRLEVFNEVDELSASINIELDKIRLEVENGIDELSASIQLQVDSITSQVQGIEGRVTTVEQTAESIISKVVGLDGEISSIEQYAKSITIEVVNGVESSEIILMAGGALIKSKSIRMEGLVSFYGLENGLTTIDGACIKTGYIDANRLNLSGSITFNDLSDVVAQEIGYAVSTAVSANNTAEMVDNVVGGWTYPGTTYIDGSMIAADTVIASNLKGGIVYLLDRLGHEAGSMKINDASSADFAIELHSGGALRLVSDSGDAFIQTTYSEIQLGIDGIRVQSDFFATPSGYHSLGTATWGWRDLYVENEPIVTSDLHRKNSIQYGLEKYDNFFDLLKPMTFRFNNGTSGRIHCGLGAQDVEKALSNSGISTNEFAGFVKSTKKDEYGKIIDGEYNYAIRYGELIPINIWQIQSLKRRVDALEKKIIGGNYA